MSKNQSITESHINEPELNYSFTGCNLDNGASGLFIDSVAQHMKIELGQECDYEREAECCKKMRDLLRLFPEFYVPNVIEELSTKQVFTTELISGLTIDQVLNSLSIMLKYIGLLEKLLVHCYYLDLILWFTNMFIPEVVIRPFKVYRDKVTP